MPTLGSTPTWYGYQYTGASSANQAFTGGFTLPVDALVTAIVFYANSDTGTTSFEGVVWIGGVPTIIGNAVGVGAGSRRAGGQSWVTSSVASPYYVAAGTSIQIGWWRAYSGSMVFSEGNLGASSINAASSAPGSTGSASSTLFGAIGAYIVYTQVGPPQVSTYGPSAVTSTTATLNGAINPEGLPSSWIFQYSTDPGFGSSSYAPASYQPIGANFDFTVHNVSTNLTGLASNVTYYYRLVGTNSTGAFTFGATQSFVTNGLPNAPTLTAPSNGNAQNCQTGSVTFSWAYNNGGAAGGETGYALQLTPSGGSPQWWNGTSLQSTAIFVTSASTSVTLGAGVLTPGVTYAWTVASKDANGTGPYASAFTLISEGPPNVPTLTTPATSSYAELAGTPTFAWTYNPSDAAGGQTAYAFRRKIAGSSSYSYWNAGTASWQSSIVWNASSAQSLTFPSASWVDGNTYNWSVATQDDGGQGGFASDFTVVAQAAPLVSVTSPTGVVTTTDPAVVWSATFPSGAGQTSYQVRTFTAAQYMAAGFNPMSSPATDDSGVTVGAAVSYQVGATLVPGTSYRSYANIIETGGESNGFNAYTAYTVTLDLPPLPTLTAIATTDPTTGAPMIQLQVQCALNLLSSVDGSFETGVGTWVGTNCALAQSSAQSLDGSFSLRLTASSAATMSAATAAYAVQPSTAYTAVASVIAGSAARTCTVTINWYNASSALISSSVGTGVADNTSTWTEVSAGATSPANAAFATVQVTVTSPANGEVHYVDEAGLWLGGSPVWSAGGFMATAAVLLLRSDGLYVRGASPAHPAAVPAGSQLVVVNDYEVTPLQPYTYAALLQATGAQGFVQTPYTSAVGASVSTTLWWELDPTNPASAVAAQPTVWNPQITEQSTAHLVMGQPTSNVVSDVMGGLDGSAEFQVFSAQTYLGLQAILTSQKTIFVSDPFGLSYYVRFGPQPGADASTGGSKVLDTQLQASSAGGPYRITQTSFVSQTRPPV